MSRTKPEKVAVLLYGTTAVSMAMLLLALSQGHKSKDVEDSVPERQPFPQ